MHSVVDARHDYFRARLLLAEDRAYSNPSKFQRAKLDGGNKQGNRKDGGVITLHNVNSILGSASQKWVLGILHQREDGQHYLEDSTFAVRVSFSQLE